MTGEQLLLTQLLAKSINAEYQLNNGLLSGLAGDKLKTVIDLAEKHKVTSLLYDALPEEEAISVKKKAMITAKQDFTFLFRSKKILDSLKEVGVKAVLIKGMATASYFDNPLSRKSGDIDILIFNSGSDETSIDSAENNTDAVKVAERAKETSEGAMEKASKVMEKLGYRITEKQLALHHTVFENAEKITVEIHTMLAEPFDSEKVNRKIASDAETMADTVIVRKCLGIELPMLDEASHAYELLLHMLQHYLRSGFGIRLLCDWVVFWNFIEKTDNGSQEIINKYLQYVTGIGIRRFSDMITLVCSRFLGLNAKIADKLTRENGETVFSEEDLNEYMNDFLLAEEFGKTSPERMVALKGRGFRELFTEFNHQTALNFPGAYRVVVIRPVLWVRTFFRFIINNKKIRNVSTAKVIKNARKRGKMNEKLKLFA